ncbi:HAD family hydrolase [Paenibacillus pinihumi]|uniref:HAD family hydrolase n=1 Tax=Paenibacillus pinihumi TaxID=669462 RepID=UPI000560D2D9
MDGTLFQTNKILEPALDATFDHLKSLNMWDQPAPIEIYRQIMGAPLPFVWERLMPDHSETDRQATNSLFHEHLLAHISSGKGDLYPGVEEVLQHLVDKGYPIYIASNGQIEYLKAIIDYYKLDRWVTETFSISQIASLSKSDLVRSIKDKYKIDNGAVIGDRLSDIRAGQDNGLISIGCNFDFAQADELAQADVVINRIVELKIAIKELTRKSS